MKDDAGRFQSLIDNLPDAFAYHRVVTDQYGSPSDYIFLEINAAFEEMTGLKRKNVISRTVSEVIPDIRESAFDWIGTYGKVALSGEPVRFESFSEPLERWYEVSAYSDKRGYFATVFREISTQKKTEESLRKNLSQFYFLTEKGPDVFWTTDLDFNYTHISPSVKKQIGYSVEDLLGTSAQRTLTPTSIKKTAEAFLTDISIEISDRNDQNRFTILDLEHVHKDGSSVWVEANMTLLRNEHGKATGVLGISRNISKRKQAENKLMAEKQEKELIINNQAELITFIDPEMRIIWANSRVIERHNLHQVDYKGQICYKLYHQLDKPCPDCQVCEALNKGKICSGIFKSPDNCYWQISGIPVHDNNGEITGVMKSALEITGIIKSHEELKESEAFTRTVMDHLPIGLAVNSVDPEVNFSYMNDNFYKIYRTTREALSKQDAFWEVVYEDPDFRSEIKNRVLKDCASGNLDKMTWENIPVSRNGKIAAYISASNIPVPDKDLMISTVWDVTDRIEAEKALRESEEKHRRLFETMAQGVVYQDADGKIISANQAAGRILGLSFDQMQAKTSMDPRWQMIKEDGTAVTGKDHPAMIAMRKGQKVGPVTRGVYHPEKDSHIWLNITAIPLFQPGEEKPFQVYAVIEDITERKQAEKELTQSEERFQRMLGVVPDMISIHDPEMNIVYSNWSGFAAVAPEKRILNTKCYKTYRGYDQICPDCQAVHVLENKKSFASEVQIAEDTWIDLRVIPLLDQNNEIEYIIEWVRDISKLKSIEDELKMLNVTLEKKVEERTAQLETVNRELDAFSYSASHDLRGPLNRISGFSQALIEDCHNQLEPDGIDYLKRINNSCDHMKLLIDDLLKLSQVSRMQLKRESVCLSSIVNTCLKELQLKEPNRLVKSIITPDLFGEGDPALLRIALENLLENAWKFSAGEEKACIEFGCEEHENSLFFFVRDNGAGFDMTYADKLFSAFQRLHDAKTYPGTGIGLSIVSRIINRHGGKIWAEGNPGEGATFFFTLPASSTEKTVLK